MAQDSAAAAGRDVALRLELVPDLGALARVQATSGNAAAREVALAERYRDAHRPYRTAVPYRQMEVCARGAHRFVSVDYTFVLPLAGGASELRLSGRELHDLRLHDAVPAPEVHAFVAALPPLSAKERDNVRWLERLFAASTLAAQAELMLDILAAWGEARHRCVSVRGLGLGDACVSRTGRASVQWRQSPRAGVFRERMHRILAEDPGSTTDALAALQTLLWCEEGLSEVPFSWLVVALAGLGTLEARPIACSPD